MTVRYLKARTGRMRTRVRRKNTQVIFFLENSGRFWSSLAQSQTTNIGGCFFLPRPGGQSSIFLKGPVQKMLSPAVECCERRDSPERDPSIETVCSWIWAGRPSSEWWKRPSGHGRRPRRNLGAQSHSDAGTRGFCFTGDSTQGSVLKATVESNALGDLEEGWL